MDVTIGVDVGGTKILAGAVDTSGRILQTARRSTAKHDAHEVLAQVADVVTEAAASGDLVAVQAFAVIGTWLGRGLADLTAILDPEMFVVGGGVADAGDLLMDHVRAVLDDDVVGHPHRPLPRVVLAEMGNNAGLIGAADLARVP